MALLFMYIWSDTISLTTFESNIIYLIYHFLVNNTLIKALKSPLASNSLFIESSDQATAGDNDAEAEGGQIGAKSSESHFFLSVLATVVGIGLPNVLSLLGLDLMGFKGGSRAAVGFGSMFLCRKVS